MDSVVLVNPKDDVIGSMDKLEAHKKGQLHRAFSVLVFNSKGEMLLQKRAKNKYHSGGLWTNACCSHPRPEENCSTAAKRRLLEEIGIEADPKYLYKFIYKAALDNDLTEYEYDHVYTCITDQLPILNIQEAEDFKYVRVNELLDDVKTNPDIYTFWFKVITDNLQGRLESVTNR